MRSPGYVVLQPDELGIARVSPRLLALSSNKSQASLSPTPRLRTRSRSRDFQHSQRASRQRRLYRESMHDGALRLLQYLSLLPIPDPLDAFVLNRSLWVKLEPSSLNAVSLVCCSFARLVGFTPPYIVADEVSTNSGSRTLSVVF